MAQSSGILGPKWLDQMSAGLGRGMPCTVPEGWPPKAVLVKGGTPVAAADRFEKRRWHRSTVASRKKGARLNWFAG